MLRASFTFVGGCQWILNPSYKRCSGAREVGLCMRICAVCIHRRVHVLRINKHVYILGWCVRLGNGLIQCRDLMHAHVSFMISLISLHPHRASLGLVIRPARECARRPLAASVITRCRSARTFYGPTPPRPPPRHKFHRQSRWRETPRRRRRCDLIAASLQQTLVIQRPVLPPHAPPR